MAGVAAALISRKVFAEEKTTIYFAEEVALDTAGYQFTGNADAPAAGVICFDFMCHYCDSLRRVIDTLTETYGNRIKFYEKPYALLDKRSRILTAALFAAEKQDGYRDMLDALFALAPRGRKMSIRQLRDTIMSTAENLHLDTKLLLQDMRSKEIRNRIRVNTAEAEKYAINSLPQVYIHGHRLKGYKPAEVYIRYIEHLEKAPETASFSSE